jgi:hypothetical protein
MTLRTLAVAIVVLGCGPSAGGDDEGDGDAGGTTDTGGASASADTAATDATGTSAGSSATTTATTGVDGSDDGPLDDGPADDGPLDDGPGLDIGGATCDFEQIVCDAADASKVPPTDCGFVTLADDVAAWQAAHTCATEAFAAEGAVKVIWQPQGIDSTVYAALVGFVGESYGITYYSYDSIGDPLASAHSCDGVVTTDDCAVGVGEMCLICTGPGDSKPLCVPR